MAEGITGPAPLKRILASEADRLSREISAIDERMSSLDDDELSRVERIVLSIRRGVLSRELEEISEVLSLEGIVD